jgi:hypothetical protein
MMSSSQDFSAHPPSFSQPPVQSHQLDDDLGFGNTTKLSPGKPEAQQAMQNDGTVIFDLIDLLFRVQGPTAG